MFLQSSNKLFALHSSEGIVWSQCRFFMHLFCDLGLSLLIAMYTLHEHARLSRPCTKGMPYTAALRSQNYVKFAIWQQHRQHDWEWHEALWPLNTACASRKTDRQKSCCAHTWNCTETNLRFARLLQLLQCGPEPSEAQNWWLHWWPEAPCKGTVPARHHWLTTS